MALNRLVTVLTINEGVLFRTRNFIPDYRYTLNFTDAWSVDEVVLLDISRDINSHREEFYEIVKNFAKNCFVPLAVGGGVRSIDEISHLLRIGADKVIINTKALEDPAFITEASKLYGSQCLVISIDTKREDDGKYRVYSHYGKVKTEHDLIAWSQKVADLGAGEIMIQQIDKDGTLEGYDLELMGQVARSVDIPVLACSGAGTWQHFVDVIKKAGVSAACTTNIYHFTESSIKSAKAFMKKSGVNVRV